MHTSGLVLDIYDDAPGDVLRSIFSSLSRAPDFIKNAHRLSHAELQALPDEAFGLVLINRGETLRKYACVDEGNTAMHVLYFLKTAHLLPEEAQKVAALRLLDACNVFTLDQPEELQKTAGLVGLGVDAAAGVAKKMGPLGMLQAGSSIAGTGGQIKSNLAEARNFGGVIQH